MSKFITGLYLFFFVIAHQANSQQTMNEFKKDLIAKEKEKSNITNNQKFGFLAEIHTYKYLIHDSLVLGGYYFAGTYKVLPNTSIGLGYSYSVYNQSLLIDLRQELGQIRIKPILFANFGYAYKGNKYTVRSSLDIPLEVQSKPNLVYNVGIGSRMYFSKKVPVGVNFGIYYKNEPGFELSEGKSGKITIDNYKNIGSACLFIGISM